MVTNFKSSTTVHIHQLISFPIKVCLIKNNLPPSSPLISTDPSNFERESLYPCSDSLSPVQLVRCVLACLQALTTQHCWYWLLDLVGKKITQIDLSLSLKVCIVPENIHTLPLTEEIWNSRVGGGGISEGEKYQGKYMKVNSPEFPEGWVGRGGECLLWGREYYTINKRVYRYSVQYN